MTRRVVTLLVALALVAAACGQKAGVAGTGGAESGSGASSNGAGSGPATSAPKKHTPGGNDTAGVTKDEIVIGIHAPVTGASPLKVTSFEVAKDIYWKWLAKQDPKALGGRTVRSVFLDDQFNPNTAAQVCRQMVEQDKVFLLVGAAGADQITACAKYADQVGVPYLSTGTNETGLKGLSTYFAVTPTLIQQNAVLVDRIQKSGKQKLAVLSVVSPLNKDVHADFVAKAKAAHLNIVTDDSIGKTATSSEIAAEAQKLKGSGADIVALFIPPTTYLALAQATLGQGYRPTFIGVQSSGLNIVTRFGCPGVANGEFFSPVPSFDVSEKLDPDFVKAYQQFGKGQAADDTGFGLWATNKLIGQMLDAAIKAGKGNLGRAAFMNTLESGTPFDNKIYGGPVMFSPTGHFGATVGSVLKADCSTKTYTTAEQAVKVSR